MITLQLNVLAQFLVNLYGAIALAAVHWHRLIHRLVGAVEPTVIGTRGGGGGGVKNFQSPSECARAHSIQHRSCSNLQVLLQLETFGAGSGGRDFVAVLVLLDE